MSQPLIWRWRPLHQLQGSAYQLKSALSVKARLAGEIRRVNRIEQHINEAAKLGFTKVYALKTL